MAKKKQDEDKAVRKASLAGDLLPPGYDTFLKQLKERIRLAQIRAALAVNQEFVSLYWQIGRDIASRQKVRGWGTKIIDRIADDLRKSLPGVEGFSRTNLYRMRAFYLAYGDAKQSSHRLWDKCVEPLPGVAGLPWGHNVVLLEQLKSDSERIWYAREAVESGWSRAVLVHRIESDLYERQGKASDELRADPARAQSDLARETLKDPYKFDFLTLGEEAEERRRSRRDSSPTSGSSSSNSGPASRSSGSRFTSRSAARTSTSTCSSIT